MDPIKQALEGSTEPRGASQQSPATQPLPKGFAERWARVGAAGLTPLMTPLSQLPNPIEEAYVNSMRSGVDRAVESGQPVKREPTTKLGLTERDSRSGMGVAASIGVGVPYAVAEGVMVGLPESIKGYVEDPNNPQSQTDMVMMGGGIPVGGALRPGVKPNRLMASSGGTFDDAERVLRLKIMEVQTKLDQEMMPYNDRKALMDQYQELKNNLDSVMTIKNKNLSTEQTGNKLSERNKAVLEFVETKEARSMTLNAIGKKFGMKGSEVSALIQRKKYEKQRLRGRKNLLSDEGIPPTDKIKGPKIDRIAAEQKQIRKLVEAGDTPETIALKVYGSDEDWAKKRVQAAMKKMPDDFSVTPPSGAVNLFDVPVKGIDDVSKARMKREAANKNEDATVTGPELIKLSDEVKQFHNNRMEVANRNIAEAQGFIDKEKASPTPDFNVIRHYQQIVDDNKEKIVHSEMILERDGTPAQIDSAAMKEIDAAWDAMVKEREAEVAPVVKEYTNILYKNDPFTLNRMKKAGINNTDLNYLIELFQDEGVFGLDDFIRATTGKPDWNKDEKMLMLVKFAKDLADGFTGNRK